MTPERRISKGYEKDHSQFEEHAHLVRSVAEAMLIATFGLRCESYEPGCDCCRRWKMLDELTKNPFED